MDDRRDLTSGDPLGGGDERPARPPGSLFDDPAQPAPAAPERPAAWPGAEPAGAPVAPERPGGYGGGPVPPGAFQPRPQRPPAPPSGALAEYWRRAVALLLDGVVVLVLGLILLTIFGALIGDGGADEEEVAGWQVVLGLVVGFVIVYPVIALVYFAAMMAATNGQTLGKLATGIRVQRTDGKPIGFWWAAYREVLIKGIVLGIAGTITGGIAYVVDFLWPLWDRQNRTLHDLVVESRVVKTRA
jgi:uncharacterized RDD family membrane protein YckC